MVVEHQHSQFAAELFDGEREATGTIFGDGDGAPVQLAGLVPSGDEEGVSLLRDFELTGLQRERKLPWFLEDRLAGGCEKGFNRGLDAGGLAPRGPRSGS